jgi:hypothetical protein
MEKTKMTLHDVSTVLQVTNIRARVSAAWWSGALYGFVAGATLIAIFWLIAGTGLK